MTTIEELGERVTNLEKLVQMLYAENQNLKKALVNVDRTIYHCLSIYTRQIEE